MTTLTETRHAGGFILSEQDGHQSRDNVTLVSGQNLVAGTVLGKITSGGKYKVYDNQASDGSEVAAGILYAGTDASGGDTACCIVSRGAEVIADELVWPDGSPTDITAGIADLLALQILVRD